jgi:hypothetical protein
MDNSNTLSSVHYLEYMLRLKKICYCTCTHGRVCLHNFWTFPNHLTNYHNGSSMHSKTNFQRQHVHSTSSCLPNLEYFKDFSFGSLLHILGFPVLCNTRPLESWDIFGFTTRCEPPHDKVNIRECTG